MDFRQWFNVIYMCLISMFILFYISTPIRVCLFFIHIFFSCVFIHCIYFIVIVFKFFIFIFIQRFFGFPIISVSLILSPHIIAIFLKILSCNFSYILILHVAIQQIRCLLGLLVCKRRTF